MVDFPITSIVNTRLLDWCIPQAAALRTLLASKMAFMADLAPAATTWPTETRDDKGRVLRELHEPAPPPASWLSPAAVTEAADLAAAALPCCHPPCCLHIWRALNWGSEDSSTGSLVAAWQNSRTGREGKSPPCDGESAAFYTDGSHLNLKVLPEPSARAATCIVTRRN